MSSFLKPVGEHLTQYIISISYLLKPQSAQYIIFLAIAIDTHTYRNPDMRQETGACNYGNQLFIRA